ncbi:type II toxin-antitoxin system HigB family toxin [Stenomitos frigidus]|uniref:Type II toxin-antitoxin system HigB family toxin n=1 Tax=Stenomitos frigidus ULC18 TaxID=2107698 RepID=A0A2T1EGQ9_9CYAN|nr:type II toxin-antitoxin system HigB family toxin [Stenomitos frigidus]PSB31875.1 type II toxin-antitoxin system HigB family toxin [Stenomitos frigidus ULC18]
MHVISYKRFREFGQTHSACRSSLDDWFKIAIGANWSHLIEVQAAFPLAEAVDNFTVFNLQGNRNRLIVSIDYKGRLINIKCILTHADYDRG